MSSDRYLSIDDECPETPETPLISKEKYFSDIDKALSYTVNLNVEIYDRDFEEELENVGKVRKILEEKGKISTDKIHELYMED